MKEKLFEISEEIKENIEKLNPLNLSKNNL